MSNQLSLVLPECVLDKPSSEWRMAHTAGETTTTKLIGCGAPIEL